MQLSHWQTKLIHFIWLHWLIHVGIAFAHGIIFIILVHQFNFNILVKIVIPYVARPYFEIAE